MIDFATPLQGMNQAEQSVNKAAARIARAPLAAASGDPQDIVDLSAEMIALLEARNNFSANAKVVQTAGDLSKTLIGMLG
ncbi:MAG: flagellar basal body rod C-terminal domain-containing protein [Bryobacteraceae bacterium]